MRLPWLFESPRRRQTSLKHKHKTVKYVPSRRHLVSRQPAMAAVAYPVPNCEWAFRGPLCHRTNENLSVENPSPIVLRHVR